MATIQQIIEWLGSGNARLIAAGVLFLIILGLKRFPVVGAWLNRDSVLTVGKRKFSLTAKRKKLAANMLLALAPAVVMLSQLDVPIGEVLDEALLIMLAAAGIQGKLRAIKPKKPANDNNAGEGIPRAA